MFQSIFYNDERIQNVRYFEKGKMAISQEPLEAE